MKVRLVKRKTIENYVAANARSRSSFRIWLTNLSYADWNQPNDIIATYGTADILGHGFERVVFNIGGNTYRMICGYSFSGNNKGSFVRQMGGYAC